MANIYGNSITMRNFNLVHRFLMVFVVQLLGIVLFYIVQFQRIDLLEKFTKNNLFCLYKFILTY